MTDESTENNEDAAWVTIETPFGNAELRAFLDDVERLYRINSMLEFEEWQQTGDRQYRLKAKNLSNGNQLETDLEVELTADGITVRYDEGLRTSTSFRVDDEVGGCAKLVVTDDYSGCSFTERESRIDEVDKSLVHWGNSLYRYLRQWKRWSWLPGWKFYMRKIWQPMKPMARRITFILIMITLVEFVFFLMVFTIFWLELDKYIN
ncbi:MAG: hypothetical protein V3R76_05835 [Gammaproteobacteria bacterium]